MVTSSFTLSEDLILKNDRVDVVNLSSGANIFIWNFGDGTGDVEAYETDHKYTQQGTFEVMLIANNFDDLSGECNDTSWVDIEVEGYDVYNVFTPNGDGVNDTYQFTDEMLLSLNVNIFNVKVPTPIDKKNKSNLNNLIKASKLIGNIIKKKSIVVYESTVYPGATEEICIPTIEKYSGFKLNKDHLPEKLSNDMYKFIDLAILKKDFQWCSHVINYHLKFLQENIGNLKEVIDEVTLKVA